MKPAISVAIFLAALAAPLTGAAAGPLVYVPMGGAGEVLVIDAAKDEIVGSIIDVPDVHGLAGGADQRYLVAGSYAETPRGTQHTPPKPAGLAEDEHNAHHGKPTAEPPLSSDVVSFVTLIETGDNAIVRRIEVPGAVHHTAIAPDGGYAVATHPNRDGISVIDMASFVTARAVATGPSPNYAVISPDNRRIYVSNAGNGTISEIDAERWTVRRNFVVGTGPEHMVLAPDGGTLYVANVDDGTVSELALLAGMVSRTFAIGGSLHGIDLSDDARTLFVSAREADALVAIDLASGQARRVPLGPAPYHLTNIAGAAKLYVSSAGADKIWVLDQQTLRVLGEITVSDRAHQMVVIEG